MARGKGSSFGFYFFLLLLAAGIWLWMQYRSGALREWAEENLPTAEEQAAEEAQARAKRRREQAAERKRAEHGAEASESEPDAEAASSSTVQSPEDEPGPAEDGGVEAGLARVLARADFVCPQVRQGDVVVAHTGYALRYDEAHEQARWVAYRLTDKRLRKPVPRSDDFAPDPRVPTGSAAPADYARSGYDRGHLAPAADMAWSATVMRESFYMSNMSPQVPDFNRGVWERLESQVRTWARKEQELYIVTGPLLEPGLKRIGRANKVSVPKAYFKVILDLRPPQRRGIGFIVPNAGSDAKLASFALSIDEVERRTGLDFFPLLPPALEAQVEGRYQPSEWKFTAPSKKKGAPAP